MARNRILGLFVGVSLMCVMPMRAQESRPASERPGSSGRDTEATPTSFAVNGNISREAQAAAPRVLKVSGVLLDASGKPVNGEVEVTFALYKQEGDEESLWTETQRLTADERGGYTALLGVTQATGIPAEVFRSDEARWLGAQVQGQVQQPRTLLVSVPYALKAVEAEKLAGKSASDFVLSESLGDQVRRVIEGQAIVASQATATGTTQPGQSKANSASAAPTTAGPMFPPSTFSGTNSTQIVRVQENGTGSGLVASTPSSAGASALVGLATSTSTSNSVFQNGVYGQNDGSGAGVAGIATNPSVGVGVYGQSVTGSGVAGSATASSGFTSGVSGDASASPNGTGVFGSTVQWVGVGGQATATSGSPAYGVWGDTASTSGAGIIGFADATSGYSYGAAGNNASINGIGVFGNATATSGFPSGVYGVTISPNGNAVVGVNNSNFGDYDNAVLGINNGISGNAYGVAGQTATTGFGAGVIGTAFATSGTPFGVFGQSASPNAVAVFGHSIASTGGVGVEGWTESPNAAAGVFVAHSGSGLILQGVSGSGFNTVFSVDANGNLSISGNLVVSGTKSSTAKLQNGREVALYAVESPENWFEDFGSTELKGGAAWVPLDASFAEATNAAVTYHVFLTPNGDSNGLYVARKTAAGFEVREHGGGDSNVAFDYRIVVRRRGYEAVRMAEVQHDVKIADASRQHLAEFVSSGVSKKAAAVKAPQIVTPPAIRPVSQRPNVQQPPKPIIPQVPKVNVAQPAQPK